MIKFGAYLGENGHEMSAILFSFHGIMLTAIGGLSPNEAAVANLSPGIHVKHMPLPPQTHPHNLKKSRFVHSGLKTRLLWLRGTLHGRGLKQTALWHANSN